jgi:pentatricopeptide repeat protein
MVLLLCLSGGPARGESHFWQEMAMPGSTEYLSLVSAAEERIRVSDPASALADLRRAAALLPARAEAHAWLGYCLSMLEQHEDALAAWQLALAADRASLDSEPLAFRRTITLARLGRYREAAEIYSLMLSRGVGPDLRSTVLLNMADMLVAASCDGLDQAIELYEECVRDYPAEAGGHFGLGAALFRAGRTVEAQRELEAASRLDPAWRSLNGPDVFFVPSYEIHLYRALAYDRRGSEAQARAEWQAYLDGGGASGCWADLVRAALSTPSPQSRAPRGR